MRRSREDPPAPMIAWGVFDEADLAKSIPTWLIGSRQGKTEYDPMEQTEYHPMEHGILPERSLCCLYGEPNVGKSFMALDWGLSIALGEDWLGRPTREKTGRDRRPGKVVYVQGEGPESMPRRIIGWLTRRHRSADLLKDAIFLPRISNFDLGAGSHRRAFIDALKKNACEDPALIVLDPLAAFYRGDENGAADMQRFADGARELIAEFSESNCSVLLVHHANAFGSRERGSTALRAAVDTMCHMTKSALVCDKQRDAPKWKTINFQVSDVTGKHPQEDVLIDLGKVFIAGEGSATGGRERRPEKAAGPSKRERRENAAKERAEAKKALVLRGINEAMGDGKPKGVGATELGRLIQGEEAAKRFGTVFEGAHSTLAKFLEEHSSGPDAILVREGKLYRPRTT
jgi:hypothetical protein